MNRALVAEKLKSIGDCLLELEPVLRTPYAEFRSTPGCYRVAERDVQLIVDSAVDVNNHLIVEARRRPPAKYFESFIELATLKVLPGPLARRLARSTGLRNRLLHEYERVDLQIVYRQLPSVARDYRDYVTRIRRRAGL